MSLLNRCTTVMCVDSEIKKVEDRFKVVQYTVEFNVQAGILVAYIFDQYFSQVPAHPLNIIVLKEHLESVAKFVRCLFITHAVNICARYSVMAALQKFSVLFLEKVHLNLFASSSSLEAYNALFQHPYFILYLYSLIDLIRRSIYRDNTYSYLIKNILTVIYRNVRIDLPSNGTHPFKTG